MGDIFTWNRWGRALCIVSVSALFGCASPQTQEDTATKFKMDLDKLKPEKALELETVPIDYTSETQDRGDFSRSQLNERFEDAPKTTVFKGSFFVMNIDQLDDVDEKKEAMEWASHGNWCGQNRPLGGSSPETVDDLDLVCKTHKICLRNSWDRNCNCDDRLIQHVSALDSVSPETKANMIEYYSHSRCIFKCRYLAKWKDGYVFEKGESRVPENIKEQFGGLSWNVSKLSVGGAEKYMSLSRDVNNYVCLEDKSVFEHFVQCARNRAGSLYRLQCLEDSYIKKGIVMDVDLDAEAVRDTHISR